MKGSQEDYDDIRNFEQDEEAATRLLARGPGLASSLRTKLPGDNTAPVGRLPASASRLASPSPTATSRTNNDLSESSPAGPSISPNDVRGSWLYEIPLHPRQEQTLRSPSPIHQGLGRPPLPPTMQAYAPQYPRRIAPSAATMPSCDGMYQPVPPPASTTTVPTFAGYFTKPFRRSATPWGPNEQKTIVHTSEPEGLQLVTRYRFGHLTSNATNAAEVPTTTAIVPRAHGKVDEVWRCAKARYARCASTAQGQTDLSGSVARSHGLLGVATGIRVPADFGGNGVHSHLAHQYSGFAAVPPGTHTSSGQSYNRPFYPGFVALPPGTQSSGEQMSNQPYLPNRLTTEQHGEQDTFADFLERRWQEWQQSIPHYSDLMDAPRMRPEPGSGSLSQSSRIQYVLGEDDELHEEVAGDQAEQQAQDGPQGGTGDGGAKAFRTWLIGKLDEPDERAEGGDVAGQRLETTADAQGDDTDDDTDDVRTKRFREQQAVKLEKRIREAENAEGSSDVDMVDAGVTGS